MASAVGRTGAMVMPYFLLKSFFINHFYPFWIIMIICFIGVIAGICMPFDTRGMEIDIIDDDYV